MTRFTTQTQDFEVTNAVDSTTVLLGADASVPILNAAAVTSVSAYPATHRVKFVDNSGNTLYLLATSVAG